MQGAQEYLAILTDSRDGRNSIINIIDMATSTMTYTKNVALQSAIIAQQFGLATTSEADNVSLIVERQVYDFDSKRHVDAYYSTNLL